MSEPLDQTASGDAAESPLTVGATLRAQRAARSLELNEASQALRIDIAMIQALEADDFDAFSAPVFAKGYLKRYAAYLGLDPEAVLGHYQEQVGEQDEPVVNTNPPIKLRDERQIALSIVAGALLVVVTLAAVLWLRSGEDLVPEPRFTSEPLPAAPPEDTTPTELEPSTAPASRADPVAEPVSTTPNEALPAPQTESPPETAAGLLQIELTFNEDCWAEVTDASGARLFYGLGRAGARSRFGAVPPVSFLLGNVNGVAVTVDGAGYRVPPESRQGNLARFVLLEPGA